MYVKIHQIAILHICNLLYVNYTSIKLQKKNSYNLCVYLRSNSKSSNYPIGGKKWQYAQIFRHKNVISIISNSKNLKQPLNIKKNWN